MRGRYVIQRDIMKQCLQGIKGRVFVLMQFATAEQHRSSGASCGERSCKAMELHLMKNARPILQGIVVAHPVLAARPAVSQPASGRP